MRKANVFTTNFDKKIFSVRVREDIINIFNDICKNTGLNKADLTEIALLEIISKFNNRNFYNIDIDKYIEIAKSELLRNFAKKIRNEVLSKSLFVRRLNADLFKLITNDVSTKSIKNLIDAYRNEAQLYSDNKDLMLELDKYTRSEGDLELLKKQILDSLQLNETTFFNNTIDKKIQKVIMLMSVKK